ncbi:MAG: uroporphyrinogen decarboxylase family protein [Caldilineales bacterium]
MDINLKMAKEVAHRGAQFVYTGDDIAWTKGPLMSPRHFRELLYPGFCRVMRGFKELGLVVIKHTDGNLWPILDMIVDAGIDCWILSRPDRRHGYPGEIKTAYGQRIALKGNVDCASLMSYGTPEETAEATKEALRKGMPGGGYILSSSNSIHSGVKPENYLAMVRTQQGNSYPMKL